MPALTRCPSMSQCSSCESYGWRGADSYGTQSTYIYPSPGPSDVITASPSSSDSDCETCYAPSRTRDPTSYSSKPREDVCPGTSLYPRSSVETYASTTASDEDLSSTDRETPDAFVDDEQSSIPPLPLYRHEPAEPNARPSTPQDFAKLFPSLNRFSIRHDEFTSDGNMNLRVDTVVMGRRRTAIQLFHLRMYDLEKREFSLRRYCRDSGREVCNSKRKYIECPGPKPAKENATSRPTLQRSVTSAIKTLGGGGHGKPSFARTNSGGSIFGPRSGAGRAGSVKRSATATSYPSYDEDDDNDNTGRRGNAASRLSLSDSHNKTKPRRLVPTNTIKLEFSNYARVDVQRRGNSKNKRYEFEWWGHRYAWRRSVDKQLGLVSFHLVRDGHGNAPIAHIVPETRSPAQVLADEVAGGWVPPCFMWIADEKVLQAQTDVADVIMATGLIALVDNCIKERWQTKKTHRIPVPLTSKMVDMAPRALMQQVFGRRNSNESHHPSSPLRYAHAIPAY
ncbi:hypothetical protein VTK73DRAFT_5263 [Phialemonium thermophilum]|uniref:Uncharacterized protein n=1 Tax=Phialemonium thermophilum TaxID=223376 RepID=A0ABR3WP23_9PEZI